MFEHQPTPPGLLLSVQYWFIKITRQIFFQSRVSFRALVYVTAAPLLVAHSTSSSHNWSHTVFSIGSKLVPEPDGGLQTPDSRLWPVFDPLLLPLLLSWLCPVTRCRPSKLLCSVSAWTSRKSGARGASTWRWTEMSWVLWLVPWRQPIRCVGPRHLPPGGGSYVVHLWRSPVEVPCGGLDHN